MNSRKKISFLIGALSPGGAERVISNLSNQLIDTYDIVIITFKKSSPFYSLDDRIKVIYCKEFIDKPKSFLSSLKLNYQLTKKVSSIIKQEKINLIIGFITSANIIAVIAAKLNRIPSIISERNNPIIVKESKFWDTLRRIFYPKASKLVLQTAGVKQFYNNKVQDKNIVIIPNPISPELLLARNNNITKEKIILSIGRLEKHKRHDLTIKAFKNIKQEGWKLIIAGVGPEEDELRKYIKKNQLTDKVELVGKITEIETYYNKSKIFVFSSQYEGYPNVLIEAMSFGIPTISSNCDFGPSDIITEGENGFLFPVDDQNELEKRLESLINDENLREKFSKNSILKTKKFKTNLVANQWDEVIKSFI